MPAMSDESGVMVVHRGMMAWIREMLQMSLGTCGDVLNSSHIFYSFGYESCH